MGGPPLPSKTKHKTVADNSLPTKKKNKKQPMSKRKEFSQKQVLPYPNLESMHDGSSISTPKKRRTLGRDDVLSTAGHCSEAPFENPLIKVDQSAETEKQALREWVEKCMERDFHGSAREDRHVPNRLDFLHTNFNSHKSSLIGHAYGESGSSRGIAIGSNNTVSNGIIMVSGFSNAHIPRLNNVEIRDYGSRVVPKSLNKKRKIWDDKVLQYVLKRRLVPFPESKLRTTKIDVVAWGRTIPVTVTSEASTIQEWLSTQKGDLFGLDVEWRPNRAKDQKNKVALLQLCTGSECLIIQMLFLDSKPPELCEVLSDPSKRLAGVGVLADIKRLLHDHSLHCEGGIELTTLAVERLKREELRHVGLKVLVQEVLGVRMDKPKRVTLSNWAKAVLDPAQIDYACIDAWASFALLHKLLGEA